MRYALTDRQWKQIEHLLPENGHRGNQWKDHRTMINGILWILRTGAPWRDLPKEFGPWKTVYERFRLWSRDGFWDTLLSDLKVKKKSKGKDQLAFVLHRRDCNSGSQSVGRRGKKMGLKASPTTMHWGRAEAASEPRSIWSVMAMACRSQPR